MQHECIKLAKFSPNKTTDVIVVTEFTHIKKWKEITTQNTCNVSKQNIDLQYRNEENRSVEIRKYNKLFPYNV